MSAIEQVAKDLLDRGYVPVVIIATNVNRDVIATAASIKPMAPELIRHYVAKCLVGDIDPTLLD